MNSYGYLFSTLGNNLIQCVAQVIPALTIGSFFSCFLCLFDTPPSERERVCVHSGLILYISCPILESVISPQSLVPFLGKQYQRSRSGHHVFSLLLGILFYSIYLKFKMSQPWWRAAFVLDSSTVVYILRNRLTSHRVCECSILQDNS